MIEATRTVVCSEGDEGRHRLGGVETGLSGTMVMFCILVGALVTRECICQNLECALKTCTCHHLQILIKRKKLCRY